MHEVGPVRADATGRSSRSRCRRSGALVAEPLFLLADSAIVGRLGTVPLAALGIAGGLLAALVSAFVFLAYGTTAAVARRVGAGDRGGALQQGIDGLWLAAGHRRRRRRRGRGPGAGGRRRVRRPAGRRPSRP